MEALLVSQIVKRQRIVYKGDMANSPGYGAVVAVVEKRPCPSGLVGKMFSMDLRAGRLVPVDDSKSFDIALDDGRLFRGVYVSNIGGEFGNGSCRFMLADGVVGEEESAALLAGVAMKVASDKAKADAEAAAFEAAKAEALAAGRALGLIPEDEFRKAGKRGSAAASNMRAELKKAGIKARVKQDGYSAINVYVEKAEDKEAAELIGNKYEGGYFDGMQDIHVSVPNPWGAVFGDVDYVFCSVDRGF